MKHWLLSALTVVGVLLPSSESLRILNIGSAKNGFDDERRMFIPYPYSPSMKYDDLKADPDVGSHYEVKSGGRYLAEIPAEITKFSHDVVDQADGRTITLHCQAYGFPRPQVTWWKNGFEITPDRSNQFHGGNSAPTVKETMEIDGVTEDDIGYYHCQAQNTFGIDRRRFRIDRAKSCDGPCDSTKIIQLDVID